jgi:hypothetical protein
MPWPLYPREGEPVFILQEAWWVSGLFWTGAENLTLTGIRCRDRPSRRGSLYRLSYSGQLNALIIENVNLSMEKETRSVQKLRKRLKFLHSWSCSFSKMLSKFIHNNLHLFLLSKY